MTKLIPLTQVQGLLKLSLTIAIKNFLFKWRDRITKEEIRQVLLTMADTYKED